MGTFGPVATTVAQVSRFTPEAVAGIRMPPEDGAPRRLGADQNPIVQELDPGASVGDPPPRTSHDDDRHHDPHCARDPVDAHCTVLVGVEGFDFDDLTRRDVLRATATFSSSSVLARR